MVVVLLYWLFTNYMSYNTLTSAQGFQQETRKNRYKWKRLLIVGGLNGLNVVTEIYHRAVYTASERALFPSESIDVKPEMK